MLSRIRRQLNLSTGLAFIALVFAMTGAALAVGGHARDSLRHKAAVSTGNAGPRGPAGRVGFLGRAGKEGKEGPVGNEGPVGKQGSAGKEGPEGSEGPIGKQGERGPRGQPEFTTTLPSNETETGAWSLSPPAKTNIYIPISFTIPLAERLEASQVHWLGREESSAQCPGSAEKPLALPGNLCVYEYIALGSTSKEPPEILVPGSLGSGAGTLGAGPNGAVLFFGQTEFDLGWGTWAVTAPEAE
jgi:hypothetical protein